MVRPLLVVVMLGVLWRPASAQTVRCDLMIRSYATDGTCVSDATAQPGVRKQLAFIWPADTVDVFLSTRPSDDPPWRGVLLANEFLVPFEIDREQPNTAHERLVLRTGWSWVVVHEWREIDPGGGGPFGMATASLVFGLVDYPPAGPDDVAIIEMALARLRTLPAWDREDDRNCANDPPGQASLFCALASAVREHMGQYHHRQPALELVRAIITERWPDRFENHRLRDFNNHPSTTLDDVRAVLEEALTLATDEAGQ